MSKRSGVTGKTVLQLASSQAGLRRTEARATRNTEEQLKLLDTRPGKSRKERARLIESEK
jgi:hypothetical protein